MLNIVLQDSACMAVTSVLTVIPRRSYFAAGNGVMTGYLKNDKATADSFDQVWIESKTKLYSKGCVSQGIVWSLSIGANLN